jgi:hypothetical protein
MNKNRSIVAASVLSAAGVLGMGGCSNALQGGLTGAGLGSLAGMGLGSLSGHMGEGAAAGAILGGLGGAVIGDQNARASGYGSGAYVGDSVVYGPPPTTYYYGPPCYSGIVVVPGPYVHGYYGHGWGRGYYGHGYWRRGCDY